MIESDFKRLYAKNCWQMPEGFDECYAALLRCEELGLRRFLIFLVENGISFKMRGFHLHIYAELHPPGYRIEIKINLLEASKAAIGAGAFVKHELKQGLDLFAKALFSPHERVIFDLKTNFIWAISNGIEMIESRTT